RIQAKALPVVLGLLAALVAPTVRAEAPPCTAPVLSGPKTINAGEGYSLSWTGVLPKTASDGSDGYEVQRSATNTFTTLIDRIRPWRPPQQRGAPRAGLVAVPHGVVVVSPACASASSASAALTSNVLSTQIRTTCDYPEPVEGLAANPPSPPALSTYVVS